MSKAKSAVAMKQDVASCFFSAGALRMHALTCGDPDAPPVVLLHGFPELSESWRDVLPMLAEAGFFAVAPDLRGYGQTDKPDEGYDIDTLAGDIVALIHALGCTRAHVVGHDWGGVISYHLAAFHPESVERLVVVNAPHMSVILRASVSQLFRSWYVFLFQIPFLAERLLTQDGGAPIARLLRKSAIDKTRFTRERLAPFTRNFAERETARAALAYYRQIFRGLVLDRSLRQRLLRYPKIRAPFRLIWGERDQALGIELTHGLARWFDSPVDVRYLKDAGHFAPIEAPEQVGKLIVEHLRETL